LLGVNLTKQREHCLAHLRMVRPLCCPRYDCMGHLFDAFVDAESSSARRPRAQQYYALEGSKTTFHHYVPTNGGKAKPSQAVPLSGLILFCVFLPAG
jgi:hypothetical protein